MCNFTGEIVILRSGEDVVASIILVLCDFESKTNGLSLKILPFMDK